MSVNRYKDGQLTLIAGSGDSNTFTGTKAEVEQAIAAGKIKENWTVYITDDLEDIVNPPGGSNCDCKVKYLTQEQYDTIPNSEKLTNNIEYRITDSDPSTLEAKNMNYDNSESGINAENIQDAIDVVNDDVNTLNEIVNTLNKNLSTLNNSVNVYKPIFKHVGSVGSFVVAKPYTNAQVCRITIGHSGGYAGLGSDIGVYIVDYSNNTMSTVVKCSTITNTAVANNQASFVFSGTTYRSYCLEVLKAT